MHIMNSKPAVNFYKYEVWIWNKQAIAIRYPPKPNRTSPDDIGTFARPALHGDDVERPGRL